MACLCVVTHVPAVVTLVRHHWVPQSWVALGAVPLDPEVSEVCGTSHDSAHTLYNEYVHHGGEPPWDDHVHPGSRKIRPGRKRFSRYLREIAVVVWEHRPNDRPPFTTAAG